MKNEEILSRVDHTNLDNCATWEQIKQTIDEGIRYGCASVCVMPCHLHKAVPYAAGRIGIAAAVGFPRGDYTTEVKVFEAKQAVEAGAAEIDMVINLCAVKEQDYEAVLADIKAVKAVCPIPLKVIVETSELTEQEKITLCGIVTESGAEFIKTSTGFSGGGAVLEDIRLFRQHLGPQVKIKASGGIKTREDAVAFIEAGADRIGTKFTAAFVE